MRKRLSGMFTSPETVYPEEVSQVIIAYDVRIPGVEERFVLDTNWCQYLHRERLAWSEDGDVEMVDRDHPVLIIRPGGAQRLAA
jgi:hypothetical protein